MKEISFDLKQSGHSVGEGGEEEEAERRGGGKVKLLMRTPTDPRTNGG